MVARRSHLCGRAVTMAISSGSGGMGKKELSANDKVPRAYSACFFWLQLMTQRYDARIHRRGAWMMALSRRLADDGLGESGDCDMGYDFRLLRSTRHCCLMARRVVGCFSQWMIIGATDNKMINRAATSMLTPASVRALPAKKPR